MPQDDWLWITGADPAGALLTPATLRLFKVFMADPVDLYQAAEQLGVKRTTLRYHVRRFLDWGLLRAVDASSERGRSRRRYQAVSQRLYIPFQATSYATLTEMLTAMQRPLFEAFVHQLVTASTGKATDPLDGGVLIQADSVDFSFTAPPCLTQQQDVSVDAWSSWTTVHLTAAEAVELKIDLAALWRRYLALDPSSGHVTSGFTLHLGLAPE